MNKILVSHETPLCLLERSKFFNDYSYCLPHLMDHYESYKNFFLKEKPSGRIVYMDNSVHELLQPYPDERLLYWLEHLQPNEFFVPDYLEDKTSSIVSAKKWINYQNNFPNTIFIAVVQAKSYAEAIECYQIYKDLGYKKIAFSYGASYYLDIHPHPNKYLGKAFGRNKVINQMYKDKIISHTDSIHLLGCNIPGEFGPYTDLPFIKSIDTSNPIMATIDGTPYKEFGLYDKPKATMNTCMEIPSEKIDVDLLHFNLEMFKKINNFN